MSISELDQNDVDGYKKACGLGATLDHLVGLYSMFELESMHIIFTLLGYEKIQNKLMM